MSIELESMSKRKVDFKEYQKHIYLAVMTGKKESWEYLARAGKEDKKPEVEEEKANG